MIINVVYGFLGAGKTTFIRRVMEDPPQDEKVVILVNEFGEVGIDGLILSGRGAQVAEVVELPSGCICCTIASDFRRQLLDLTHRIRPDRMIVEPTGVATIAQIMQILEAEDIRPIYNALHLVHLLDASEFLSFIKSHRHFMENQIRRSRSVVLNKMDRIKPALLDLLISSIKEINPDVMVHPTSFARLDSELVRKILGSESDGSFDDSSHDHSAHEQHHHHEHGLADQFESFGQRYSNSFSLDCLETFFNRLRDGHYGSVFRAKGIFHADEDWVKLELASGQVFFETVPAAESSVVSIIGRKIVSNTLDAALTDCVVHSG